MLVLVLRHNAVEEFTLGGFAGHDWAEVVARGKGAGPGPDVQSDIQAFMKKQLSQHEYPRQIEFVGELPKTPAGKINRKVLRDAAAQAR